MHGCEKPSAVPVDPNSGEAQVPAAALRGGYPSVPSGFGSDALQREAADHDCRAANVLPQADELDLQSSGWRAEAFQSGKHYFFSAVSTAGCHPCPTKSSPGIRIRYRLNRRNLEWHFFMRRKQADGLDVHNRQTIAPSIHLDASTQRQSRDPAACAGQVRQELTAKTRRADRA